MTGNLPDDFLRLDAGQGTVIAPGVTVAPSAFVGGTPFMPAYYQKGGVLSLTVAQVSYL